MRLSVLKRKKIFPLSPYPIRRIESQYICKMTAKRLSLLFIFIPLISFAQSAPPDKSSGQAVIKNIYPISKHHHISDTIKSICYPLVYDKSGVPYTRINNIISSAIFGEKKTDTTLLPEQLLNKLYAKYPGYKMTNSINRNKTGYLSITVNTTLAAGEKKPPLYFNFDLTTGKLLTLHDLLNTKNDSISMRQAILPQMADSIRNFEQTLDKNNPNYSDIIEQLNSNLATFIHTYPANFIMTDKELVFCFNCFIPANIFPYQHIYIAGFPYKTLRSVMKKAIAFNLQ